MEAREDFWSVSGDFIYRHNIIPREQIYVPKESSENWSGSTRFKISNKRPPKRSSWVDGRLTKAREEGAKMSKCSQRKAVNKWAEEKPKLDAAGEQRGIYFIPDDDGDEEASAMPCNTTPADPNGSSWERLCAIKWSKMETKRLNSSCSKKDHEHMIMEVAKDWNNNQ